MCISCNCIAVQSLHATVSLIIHSLLLVAGMYMAESLLQAILLIAGHSSSLPQQQPISQPLEVVHFWWRSQHAAQHTWLGQRIGGDCLSTTSRVQAGHTSSSCRQAQQQHRAQLQGRAAGAGRCCAACTHISRNSDNTTHRAGSTGASSTNRSTPALAADPSPTILTPGGM